MSYEIRTVIVELEYPMDDDYLRDYSDEYYGIGTELVRCKDCKHKHIKDNVWACPFGLPAGCDFYCGYAERKEE